MGCWGRSGALPSGRDHFLFTLVAPPQERKWEGYWRHRTLSPSAAAQACLLLALSPFIYFLTHSTIPHHTKTHTLSVPTHSVHLPFVNVKRITCINSVYIVTCSVTLHTLKTNHYRKSSSHKEKRKKKKRREKYKNNQKTSNKMTISIYLSIITLNGNGINPPINRHRVAD